jgi:DNA-binding PadR family transcriptional regulator
MTSDELVDFLLNKDGGLGIILTVDEEIGNTHTEFENQVSASKVTISNRLQEAVELGLLEYTRLADDHGNAKRYTLTEEGERLRHNLGYFDLEPKYKKMVELQQEVERDIDRTITRMNQMEERVNNDEPGYQ